jgi:ssDNA-binding Zn-finger/Zn-ribbon topoisomerase 1
MKHNIVETKAKCPKCKSTDLNLVEVWEDSAIHWQQIDGKIERDNGSLEPGNAFKVQATCMKCKHWWTIKGAQQIDDIVK